MPFLANLLASLLSEKVCVCSDFTYSGIVGRKFDCVHDMNNEEFI